MNSIIHIIADEKFIDIAINIFDKLKDIHNNYLCYTLNNTLNYIKKKEYVNIYNQPQEILEYINNSNTNLVILHGLILPYKYLNKISTNIKVLWISWGYDIYCLPTYQKYIIAPIKIQLYKPLTYNFLKRKEKFSKQYIKNIIKRLLYYPIKQQSQFYQRVNFLSTVLPIEYDLVKKNPLFNNTKYFYFSYIREQEIEERRPSGKNILLGNSGDATNNHLDVLNILKDLELEDRKIIMPLSYSANPKYIVVIKKFISQHYPKNKIIYLEKFMNYSDYCSLIQSCDIAIFGHIRQQAMGNITAMLTNGSKVYLYTESIAYQQLTQNGYKIFPLEQLTNTINTPIDEKDIKKNIQLLKNQENFPNLINSLQKNINKILLPQ